MDTPWPPQRRCSGSISPLSTHPWNGTALGSPGHQMKFMNGLACEVFSSTRSSPSSYKSLFSPAKGRSCLVIKESGRPTTQGGGGCPCLHCQAGPVSWPGALRQRTVPPGLGVSRTPSPAHRDSPEMRCAGCPWRQTHLCFRKALSPHCHGSPVAPQGHSRGPDLPATELGGSQRQTHAGRRQRAGAGSGSKGK